jgi:molecular chaperone DnaK (HSP70)
VDDGMAEIHRLLEAAGVHESAIAFCLATGGVVRMPYVRQRLVERFGIARLPDIDQSERVIAQGAAWLAYDKRRLRLAKPFEILHADNSYVPIVHQSTRLPVEGDALQQKLSMYCVDPRDGFAKLQFARPRQPGRIAPSDPRSTYGTMTLGVDADAGPMFERIEVAVEIDHDLIATVRAQSKGDRQLLEIHDLEFGLALQDDVEPGTADTPPERARTYGGRRQSSLGQTQPGSVRLRSNVTDREGDWPLVPGEIVGRYMPGYMDARTGPPGYQVKERLYYEPCARCGRMPFRCGCRADA